MPQRNDEVRVSQPLITSLESRPIKVNKEIRFAGLRRSGNHAVISWILKQAGNHVLFFNDVEPEDPLDPSRRFPVATGDKEPTNGVYDCLLYSYEDRLLNVVASNAYYPQAPHYEIEARERFDVIVLRDPFNTMASRISHSETPEGRSTYISGLSVPELWVTYALEFAGKTNHLRHRRLAVNFNLWRESKDYRRLLAEHIGLEFTDAGFQDVAAFGKGSSFDHQDFSGRASEMATDQRWLKYARESSYRKFFTDKRLLDLAEDIFGFDPELIRHIKEDLRPKIRLKSSIAGKLKTKLVAPFIAYARTSSFVRWAYYSFIQGKLGRGI